MYIAIWLAISGCKKQASNSYTLVQCYCMYIYTHTKVKRLKGSRVNREGYRRREVLYENVAYGPPVIKATILTMKSLQVKRKEKVALQKKLPLHSKQQNGPEITTIATVTVAIHLLHYWCHGKGQI